MSASPNSPNKIAKIRTFAQDAEKHANRSIDDVRAAHNKKATDSATKDTTGKTSAQSEVLDLDNVTTADVTETKASPIPKKKQDSDDEDTKSATGDTASTEDEDKTPEKDISNPPFHKLDAERKKAAEKISASSETLSSHPESLLSGDKKQTVDVDDDEATSGATIVTDTKSSRKSVLDDIGDSVTGWFSKVKNTYITPPKPSYTVSKSERRAGILKDATAQTGTDLVDHDSFAARIRERYQNAAQADTPAVTEPAWLPSLPSGNKRDISDVQTVPRKSVQNEPTEPKKDTKSSVASSDHSEPTPVPQKEKEVEAPITPAATAPKADPSPTEPKKAIEKKETPDNTATKPVTPKAVPQPTTTTPAPESAAARPKTPDTPDTAVTKKPAVDEPAPPAESEPADPEPKKSVPTPPKPPTAEKPVTDAAAPEAPAPTPTPPTNTAPTTQIDSEPYIVPSDEELDEEAVWADRQATNRLSLGIVLGTTVAIVAGVIVYSIAPLFLDRTNDSNEPVAALFGDNVQTLAVGDWSDTLARTQAVQEAMNADITGLQYVALEANEVAITDPGQMSQVLNINVPVGVQTNVRSMHAGNYRGTPFLYVHAPDTAQTLGAFLAWETSMSADLQSLLPINDHSGEFVDRVISDTYDARAKRAADDTLTMTYTILGDYVLITPTADAAALIIPAL